MSYGACTTWSQAAEAHFTRSAAQWSALGVWCSLWDPAGKLRTAADAAPNFWRLLWNHGSYLSDEFARLVRRGAGSGFHGMLLDVPGLALRVEPLAAGEDSAILVLAAVEPSFCEGEAFLRLCSRWQLDPAALAHSARRSAALGEEGLEHVAHLLQDSIALAVSRQRHQHELDQMTLELTDTYEELSLIYRIGAFMQVTHPPREHYAQVFAELSRATPFGTMAAVLNKAEVLEPEDLLIIGGERVVDEATVLKLLAALSEGGEITVPVVINSLSEAPHLRWAESWLQRLVVMPMICNDARLGTLLICNQRGDREFDSSALKLLQAVVDRSSVYLENYLLYGDLNKLLMGLMHALVASIDAKDPYTCGHSHRVAFICKRLAMKTRMDPQHAERLYLSGLLHDIGKIGISESVLCKPGRLSPEEARQMERHPEIGARILDGIKQLDDVIPAVLHHHEKPDGSGYPLGLSGDQIPWEALVVGLADSFDAMTTGRTYRSALPLAAALAELRRFAGTQFCPRLVDALIELVNEGLVREIGQVNTQVSFARWRR